MGLLADSTNANIGITSDAGNVVAYRLPWAVTSSVSGGAKYGRWLPASADHDGC
jgi:hypothetical protein